MGLVEVLENDSDVHVDHYHVIYDNKASEVDYCQQGVTAVAVTLVFIVRITVWIFDHERFEHVVPPGGSDETKKEVHGPAEGLKVDHVIESPLLPHVAEQEHPDYGVDEGDEGQ